MQADDALPHLVGKLVFDLRLSGTADDGHGRARALQQRLSAYCRSELEHALQPCLDAASADGRYGQIRRIELDLGRIDAAQLESRLTELLGSALRDHLRRLGLPRPMDAAPPASAPGLTQAMEPSRRRALLAWLAGGAPQGEAASTPDRLMLAAIHEAPASLARRLRRGQRHADLARRLATALPDTTLEKLLGVLAPAEAEPIAGYVRQLKLTQHSHPRVADDEAGFGVSLWTFILGFLLDSRGSAFNRRTFVAATLRHMAAHFRLEFTDLLAQLTRDIEQWLPREGRPGELLGILQSLRQAELHPLDEGEATEAGQPGGQLRLLTPDERQVQMLAALLRGRADRQGGQTPGGLDRMLQALAERQMPQLHALLQTALRSADARRRLLRGLSAQGRRRLWRRIAPALARRIERQLGQLRKTLRDLGRDTDGTLELRLMDAALAHWADTAADGFTTGAFARRLQQELAAEASPPLATGSDTDAARQVLQQGGLESTAPPPDAVRRAPEQTGGLPRVKRDGGIAELAPLMHLLSSGHAPGWCGNDDSPQCIVLRLLAGHPEALLEALRQAVIQPGVLPRLLRWLPPSVLRQLVLALDPGQGGFVLTWLQAGAALAESGALSGSQRRQSAATHWETALSLMLRPQGESYTPARFLDEAERRMAHALHLPRERYRRALQGVAARGAQVEARYAPLAELLGSPPGGDGEAPCPAPLPLSRPAYRRPGAPPSFELRRDQERAALAVLESLLRHGRPLRPAQLAALFAIWATLPEWSAARRRPWRRLLDQAMAHGLERQRLASLLPPALLQRLLPLWLPPAQVAALMAIFEPLAHLEILPASSRHRIRQQAWACLLEALCRPGHLPRSGSLPQFLLALARRLEETHALTPLAFLRALKQTVATSAVQAHRALDLISREAIMNTPPKPPLRAGATPLNPETQLPEGEAFYLGNAGLVLLWPFLGRYFEMLGLVADGRFVDEVARSRAVYLLQFLASGKHEAPESGLALNKLLCGMPLSASPEFVPPPGEEEKRIGQDMLFAVTQRWEKLRNTSVDGLRETFLMREGRLQRQAEKTTLDVGLKPFDMLLDSLPWSLGMVKLPWMDCVLFVKWR